MSVPVPAGEPRCREVMRKGSRELLPARPFCLIRHVGWNKIPSGVSREASVRLLPALKSGDQGRVQCDSHGTFDTGGTVRTRQLSGLRDRRPIERLVNKG